MSSFVICEVALCSETHIAIIEITFEGFLTIVDPHVRQKVTLFSKSFLTAFHLAYKGPLASLNNYVSNLNILRVIFNGF